MCMGKKTCSCGCKAEKAMERAMKVKPGARGKAAPSPFAPKPTAKKSKAAPAARKGRKGK